MNMDPATALFRAGMALTATRRTAVDVALSTLEQTIRRYGRCSQQYVDAQRIVEQAIGEQEGGAQ